MSFVRSHWLAAGGGGSSSGSPPPVTTAEGYYSGTLTGADFSQSIGLLVLENGELWGLYGTDSAASFSVAGFIQGTGISSSGTFTAPDTKKFESDTVVNAPVTATYDTTAKSITGSLPGDSGTVNFSAGPVAGSTYDYNAPATLTSITGSWTMTSCTGGTSAFTVASSGTFIGGGDGCQSSATIAPRPSGKNVFNLTVNFDGACRQFANQTLNGVALSYPLATGGQRLLVAIVDSTRTLGQTLFSTR